METEIEAKFLDIHAENFRGVLKKAGANLVYKERFMKRKVFEHPTNKNADWIRVRDEGDCITMSYKKLEDRSLYGTKEVTIKVDDFDRACKILESAQLKFVAYQETKREKWQLKDCEITIDTWPWIPTFVELEAKSETEITKAARDLGLNLNDALHGSVENAYQKYYDVTEEEVDDWPEIKFIETPEWLKKKKK